MANLLHAYHLAHRGAFSRDDPEGGAGLASRGDRFVTTSRGLEATATRHPGGAEFASSFGSIRNCKCADPRVKTATVGAPRGWPSLRREGCQRLASVGVPELIGTSFYPGCASRRSIRPSVGADNLKPRAQMPRERIALFDIVNCRMGGVLRALGARRDTHHLTRGTAVDGYRTRSQQCPLARLGRVLHPSYAITARSSAPSRPAAWRCRGCSSRSSPCGRCRERPCPAAGCIRS